MHWNGRIWLFVGAILGLSVFPVHAAETSIDLCPHIVIRAPDKISFTDPERRLVCGDPKLKPYEKVPLYQAEYHLRIFLQGRGYHAPVMQKKSKRLEVFAGTQSQISRIVLEPEAENLQQALQKSFIERVQNPETLDQIGGDVIQNYRERGYPCAQVQMTANVADGSVHVLVDPKSRERFGKVRRDEVRGLERAAFERFYPFDANDWFDERDLNLSVKRIRRSRIVQSSYFEDDCEAAEFFIRQKFMVGPPRSLRFGLGISTESGPLGRLRWVNHRFGKMASLLEASVSLTLRKQNLILTSDHFYWPERPRLSIFSQLELGHESEGKYKEYRAHIASKVQRSFDYNRHRLLLSAGPAYSLISHRIDDDEQFIKTRAGSLEASADFMSHIYEHFDYHPDEGRHFQLGLEFWNPILISPYTLLKVDINHREVRPVAYCGRGKCIVGFRTHLGTTFLENGVSLAELPRSLKFFGGGIDELRGYAPWDVPENHGMGALARALFGVEFRRTKLFVPSLESLCFLDFGVFGSGFHRLESPVYASSGLGLRWLSPVGLLQGYAAWSFKNNSIKDGSPYFYAGLGGEF